MKLFVYELLCAGGSAGAIADPLRSEGWAMLSALVEDFSKVAGLDIVTLLDDACPHSLGGHCMRIRPQDEPRAFTDLVRQVDAVLAIAPESGGLLLDRARRVLQAGKRWLGCAPEAIELTGDKEALGRHWARHGVPTPAPVSTISSEKKGFPLVLKPRFGAGSLVTFLVRDEQEEEAALRQAVAEMPGADWLHQVYVSGQPASIAFLIGPNQTLSLAPATQELSADGRFHYLGGRLPLEPPVAERALQLGQQAIGVIDGLAGFVGVDLVLGAAPEDDRAIEINPRPTTSYIGLRQLALDNLAEVWWRIFNGHEVSSMRWNEGTLCFRVESDSSPDADLAEAK